MQSFRTSSHVLHNGDAVVGPNGTTLMDKKGSGMMPSPEYNRGSELYKNRRIGADSALQYASTKGAVMYTGDQDRPKLDADIGNRSQNAKSSIAMMTENFDHIAAPNSVLIVEPNGAGDYTGVPLDG